MSEGHLSRIFKQECGMTLMTVVKDARIGAVQRYLELTNISLMEIVRRYGFTNAATLRRVFAKRLTVGSIDYRERFKTEDAVQKKPKPPRLEY